MAGLVVKVFVPPQKAKTFTIADLFTTVKNARGSIATTPIRHKSESRRRMRFREAELTDCSLEVIVSGLAMMANGA